MDEDKYKLWQDLMKEVLILMGLRTELDKRIDALYDKVDNQLDNNNEKLNKENQK